MSSRRGPERWHLGSEDSLRDEEQVVEMQNPLRNIPNPSDLDNLNSTSDTINTSSSPHPHLFSDDEPSSAESSVTGQRNAPNEMESRCRASSEAGSVMPGTMMSPLGTAPGAYGDTDNSRRPVAGADMTNEDLSNINGIAAHYRFTSEACSVMPGTMALPLGRAPVQYEDTQTYPPPVEGGDMTSVDLGSTNRIMALREANNGGGDGGGRGNGSRRKSGDKVRAGEVYSTTTAEPSPAIIMAGDARSGGDEVTEVSCTLRENTGGKVRTHLMR